MNYTDRESPSIAQSEAFHWHYGSKNQQNQWFLAVAGD
jgi:hypothetical protein